MKNHKRFNNGFKPSLLKQLGAVVFFSGAASVASADIVIGETESTTLSMYGLLDIGVLYQDHVTANGDEKVDIETSGITPTIFGFKGARTFANSDTSAFFNLEAHFDMDTGNFHGSGDSGDVDVLFRRQANVGLTGDWGTLIAGRQYGPVVLAHLGTEPRAYKEQFSGIYTLAYGTVSNGALGGDFQNANNDVGVFFRQALQYRNNFNGLDLGAMYSFGGQEGSQKDGEVFAVGISYPAGPLTLAASYQHAKDDENGEDVVTNWNLGTAYNFGDVTLKGQYTIIENDERDGTEFLDVESISVGLDWRWDANNSATVAYYNNEDKTSGGETNTLVLSNDYKWDSATTIYAQLAHADADDSLNTQAQFATSILANPSSIGEKTTLINVGINFAF